MNETWGGSQYHHTIAGWGKDTCPFFSASGGSWQQDLEALLAGAPDLRGRTLPSDFREGRFIWINDDPEGSLLGRLRPVEADGTAYGLSCAVCPCWTDQWSDVWDGVKLVGTTGPLGPTQPFRRAVPQTGVLSATTHRLNVCAGGGTSGYNINWTWRWCGPGSEKTSLGSLDGIVRHHLISVNGYTLPSSNPRIPPGTAIYPCWAAAGGGGGSLAPPGQLATAKHFKIVSFSIVV